MSRAKVIKHVYDATDPKAVIDYWTDLFHPDPQIYRPIDVSNVRRAIEHFGHKLVRIRSGPDAQRWGEFNVINPDGSAAWFDQDGFDLDREERDRWEFDRYAMHLYEACTWVYGSDEYFAERKVTSIAEPGVPS
jgi:hypothetical protein